MKRKKDSPWKDMPAGGAFLIPLAVLRHENWKRMSPLAKALITDIGAQYTGFNNGYLCCSWSLMEDRGWKSNRTVRKAMHECEHFGILERTQTGDRTKKPHLHAFSWRRINEKPDHRLEVRATIAPTNAWQTPKGPFVAPPERKRKTRRQLRRAA